MRSHQNNIIFDVIMVTFFQTMKTHKDLAGNIFSIQEEVKKINACLDFQVEEIRNQRKQLLYDSKCNTDLRCISFIRSAYLLGMSQENVISTANIPFMHPNGFAISERLIEMSRISTIRLEITRFIQALFKLGNRIPKLFAGIKNKAFDEHMVFIPDGIKPLNLFACSTFPSLFSYCWTPELQLAYINTMVEIAKLIPNFDIRLNRNHWIFECIKCYIFSSNIQDFIRSAIGDVVMGYYRPQNGQITTEYCQNLINTVNKVFESMKMNMALFPKDVRILIRKFAELAASSDNKVSYIESLFIDCIVEPVLSNINGFCSPLYQNLTSKADGLKNIVHLWKTALNIPLDTNIKSLFEKFDLSALKIEIFQNFYDTLISVDDKIEGPSLLHFLNLLEVQYNTTLFSIPDVCLLAFLCTKMMPSEDRIVLPFANALLNKIRNADFRFFRHETWDFELYQIKKPDLIQKMDPSTLEPLKMCAISLFKFLSVAHARVDTHQTLEEFINFQDTEAKLSQDIKTRVHLCHLITKIHNACAPQLSQSNIVTPTKQDYEKIMNALLAEIEEHHNLIKTNNDLITEISLMSDQINKSSRLFHKKIDSLMHILHSRLLDLFLSNNSNILQEVEVNGPLLVRDKIKFIIFFNEAIGCLNDYLTAIGAQYALQGVASQLHSEIMKLLPLGLFISQHQRYEVNDELFRNVNQKQIDCVCSSMDRDNLPNILSYASRLIKLSNKVEIPLISLHYIAKACKLITQAVSIFPGKSNNTRRMLSYSILKSNNQHSFSFLKYLEFFLKDITVNGLPLFSEKIAQSLHAFSKSISELDIILCEI